MLPEREAILVIEDSRQLQMLIRAQILEPAGYQVMNAYDGATGMALIRSADLVLLDINLPGLSGMEFLKSLREKGSQVPVIMMTGESSEARILQCFRLGAQDFLQKPFIESEALHAIDRALTQRRLQRENHHMQRQLEIANQRLQSQVHALSNLQLIGQAITSTLDEADLYRRLMDGINRLMRVEASSLFILDEQSGDLVMKISLSGEVEDQAAIRLRPGQGVAGWVAQQATPALIPDASSDPRFFPEIDSKTGFKTRSLLTVPLISQNRVLGVLQMINPNGPHAAFDQVDLEIMRSLAAFVAVGIENARLHSAARRLVTVETLSQVTITLSHYINNSLTVILLAAEKMQTAPGIPPAHQGEIGRALQEEAQHIGATIAALRKSTSIETVEYAANSPMLDIERDLKTWMALRQ